jgi:pimeloyl-ACP methyl ester carboxylesterase
MSNSKPLLICLPGLMCDATVWQNQVQELTTEVRCLVPAWGLRDSLKAMARQVLEEATSETFSLVGHSMGGRVALEVWRQAPHRVQRLALMSTGTTPLPLGEAGEKERAGRMALVELAQTRGMRVMGRQWAAGMVHPDRHNSPLFEAVLDMLDRSNPRQFAAQQQALLGRPDATPLLPGIACPTLVLTGKDDTWSGPVQHHAIATAIPGAELVIVPGASHMVTMEKPVAVSEALRAWLSR